MKTAIITSLAVGMLFGATIQLAIDTKRIGQLQDAYIGALRVAIAEHER